MIVAVGFVSGEVANAIADAALRAKVERRSRDVGDLAGRFAASSRTILKPILAENGQPVEFGEPLFAIHTD